MCNQDIKTAREIIEVLFNSASESPDEYTLGELKGLFQGIIDKMVDTDSEDFYFETEGGKWRFIHYDAIDEIWTNSLIDQIKECYDLSSVPDFVSIDWGQTAENCKVDGMGHHFATYDGHELNAANYHIFRTN